MHRRIDSTDDLRRPGTPRRSRGLPRVAPALRGALREGYGGASLRRDVLSGLVVGIVALPLSMALAIATGVPPQHGLFTAIVAGAVIAALGGSRVQISGPTAAFVVVLAPIVTEHGLAGLCLATLLAGLLLMVMGFAGLGRMIQFIPSPVTVGFTAGIGVVIAILQVKDFFGLAITELPDDTPGRVLALARALPGLHWPDLVTGTCTLAILVWWPRVTRAVPSPVIALLVMTLAAAALQRAWPAFDVVTIADRFTWTLPDGRSGAGIPPRPPLPLLPWTLPGADGQPLVLSRALIQSLLPAAFAIAMLGAIESLLSAVVADGMTGGQHDPDAELVAQGAGNLVAPFFGGFAATGAIARTATNVRAGGRSPVAAIVHSIVVLLSIILLAPLLGFLPMASMAALLLLVAWNMAEPHHVVRLVRIAPRSDVLVLLSCIALTVAFDMVVAVVAGVLLATVLFIRRMAEVSGVRLVGETHAHADVPPGVLLYDVGGPLFFGAAQKAMREIRTVGDDARVVLLDLRDVPAMDATGLVNLESAIADLRARRIVVILAGVQPQPLSVLRRAGVSDADGVRICERVEDALPLAGALAVSAIT